jgi:DNA-directed RNA polymerase subunit beta'
MSHPVDAVGRSVVVPDVNLTMDQVGVPEDMAWDIYGPHTMREMVRAGMPAVEAASRIEQQDEIARKHLIDAMKKWPLMYSRDPALHRYSIMGAEGVLVPGHAIRTSPLVAKPFGLDHDGDCMNLHIPVTADAANEIREKMLPSHNLLSIRNRKVQYLPSQEMVLGVFNSTVPRKEFAMAHVMKFKTREDAMEAYRKHLIPIDAPIQIGD